MNVKDTLDLLMKQLGNRKDPEFRETCLKQMTVIQQNLEGMAQLPWFLISEEATTVTTPGERRILLPQDFIREVEEQPLTLDLVDETEDDVKIHRFGYDEAFHEFGTAASGKPFVYTIRGFYILLFPVPDDIYTLRLSGYYARQAPPTDNVSSENQWFRWASDLIMANTGMVMAALHIKDREKAQDFNVMQQTALARLEREQTAREEANRDRRMN